MAAALLVFSPRCAHCQEIIRYLQSEPRLQNLIQFHNVHERGIPPQFVNKITKVPTLLTKNQKILVGKEVKTWLASLLPPEITFVPLGSKGSFQAASFNEGGGRTADGFFQLDDYGKSLQPPMTPELEAKISQDVGKAFNSGRH